MAYRILFIYSFFILYWAIIFMIGLVQTERRECSYSFPRCSLSYAKLVQTECNQACLELLRCRLSYSKLVQTERRKCLYSFPRRRLSYAKLVQNIGISKFLSYIFLFIIFCMGLLCHVVYLCFLCKSVLSLFHNLRCLVCFVRNLIF